jgi:superfamily I DNA/RNA helicase
MLSALLDKLDEYEEREVNKAMAAKQEEKAQQISDKVSTLRVLASGFPGGTVADLVKRIDSLFGDLDDPNNPPPPGVVLMTAHKSKGLEFPRVFLYGEEKFMPSRFARQDWQHIQEQNLVYVAYTRAEQTLVKVRAL